MVLVQDTSSHCPLKSHKNLNSLKLQGGVYNKLKVNPQPQTVTRSFKFHMARGIEHLFRHIMQNAGILLMLLILHLVRVKCWKTECSVDFLYANSRLSHTHINVDSTNLALMRPFRRKTSPILVCSSI